MHRFAADMPAVADCCCGNFRPTADLTVTFAALLTSLFGVMQGFWAG